VAELGLPVFVTIPNIQRLIDELIRPAMMKEVALSDFGNFQSFVRLSNLPNVQMGA